MKYFHVVAVSADGEVTSHYVVRAETSKQATEHVATTRHMIATDVVEIDFSVGSVYYIVTE